MDFWRKSFDREMKGLEEEGNMLDQGTKPEWVLSNHIREVATSKV
jgi:hypothetical protein